MADFDLVVCSNCGKPDHAAKECPQATPYFVFTKGNAMGKTYSYMVKPTFEQRQYVRLTDAIKDAARASGFNCNPTMEHFLVELLQRLNLDTK